VDVLFVDIDVTVLLGIGNTGGERDGGVERKYKSQIKYSDKARVQRFRDFAAALFEERGGTVRVAP
jgi:hypothetical protein